MRLGINGRFYGAPATGVQRAARELARRLVARVDDAVLLLPAGVAAPRDVGAAARPVRGRLRGHLWEQLELPRRARAARCDVVLHLANTAPVSGGPHVVLIHDVLALTNPEWFSGAFALWYRVAQRRAARRAAAVGVFTGAVRAEAERVLGVPAARLGLVPQGVEPFDRPASPASVARVRARHRLPELYLLTTGAADPRKNLPFLLAVLERWRARRGAAPTLAVVGPTRSRVHARPGGGGGGGAAAAGFVRFLGPVSDAELRALYTGAAVFCHPSLAEGFGRPPLEAMGCGTPVVAAPYGPAREVLGDAAAIVPLEVDAWIAAVERLLAPGAPREIAIARGRLQARRHRWEDAAAAVLELCRAAAGPPPGARAAAVGVPAEGG